VLVLLACGQFLRESWAIPAQTDDAYISYRYARNLVEGLGLVYNPGERVEGITNLLWTLLVAAGITLGFEAKAVGHVLGVASGVAVLLLTALLARGGGGRAGARAASVAPWIVLSFVPFAYWTTSGMETPLFAALVTATLLAHARGRAGWTVATAFLATLTRPDGILVAGVVLAERVARGWGGQRWRALLWPGVYALLVLAVTGARLAYYGTPLPNTFYAKVGGVPPLRGVHYALGFYVGAAWPLLVPALLAVARDPRVWSAGAYLVVVTLYSIGVGGDAFPYSRFFVPALPALCAAAARGAAFGWERSRGVGALGWVCVAFVVGTNVFGFHRWSVATCTVLVAAALALAMGWERRRPAPVATAALVAALALGALGAYPKLDARRVGGLPGRLTRGTALELARFRNFELEELGKIRALRVVARSGHRALVATGGIGAFGYHGRFPIVDVFGIVDPVVARGRPERPGIAAPGHLRSNADYVLGRDPDYFLIPRRGDKAIKVGVAPAFAELWSHPDFQARYVWDEDLEGYRRRIETR
jgi:hypothetical protein